VFSFSDFKMCSRKNNHWMTFHESAL
jgi:hypothetical protein